ncbi:MAG: asparagine synthetase B [Stygiobacter sp. RIFOXYC12_FULL_38_8]|nr:MAG: asparagine synthetase B [Stygiobacter sp. RIFOXYA12_FULL_38_9]OGV07079.1 MAG: asparagine synthetase B [Stygiobacter sp. RIFOXYB2_FULL_37_11]OGV11017.1 MAG: asparagine synthetase B [Stygiobacter sp. RIFOXYA2_FULL_38_8]OGV12405.1 MAG: asparagine synthetase B [Stygiobacter sp. RIFOXYC2_FULL_38_25]OGV25272.1 MAG: asparagine synthetase B [Stygiobacter sp. RIFOXYC12_FULL_38_8]OGV83043.1 MAG: asparagine synthetase B [Stygiobacter sp. GWF2_38_21]RJQ58145.1 MAG: asparagine synthetase B [Stygio
MKKLLAILLLLSGLVLAQSKILIYMDLQQTDHLKAYGITFNALQSGSTADWLLNYRGGSFMLDYSNELALKCRIKGVSFQPLSQQEVVQIYALVQSEDQNMDVVRLEKAPNIAVYVPPNFKPWDDAVTLALDYAEVKYDKIWIEEILRGDLEKYDWLHLHHEDFTGQYGKFYASFSEASWYVEQQVVYEKEAKKLGFKKVSDMEKAVAATMKNYVGQGGFLFAMCSATDSYDISLSTQNVDIADRMYDGDPPDLNAQDKVDFAQTFAFENFKIEMNPLVYEYSDIDIAPLEIGPEQNDFFTLFDFSAKYDPVPTMLTQNHLNVIHGFMGQTSMFRRKVIKNSVIILGERAGTDQVKYIHGSFGRGTFTFYGGHDPEDYQHAVGDPPTDLTLFKNSPGYRLILNNILFPAAKKKEQKT